MLIQIPRFLSDAQVAECRAELDGADWTDGRASAGYLSSGVKDNAQLPEGSAAARKLGELIMRTLESNTLFTSAALPFKVLPPFFNRYSGGQSYGRHIDGAIRQISNTVHRVRTDLAATLFLTPPEEYDGGELVVEDTFGARRVKLGAGDLVLYPGTSVHGVEPVTRGTRLAAFFWVQSMVRDEPKRDILYDLSETLGALRGKVGSGELSALTAVYHNLLRMWAET